MRQIKSEEVRRNLRTLLNEVERDDAHITILRYDTPSAVLVPMEWYERAMASLVRDAGSEAGSEADPHA